MIGEYFLDTSITICCSIDTSDNRASSVFEAIKFIVNWYKKEIPKDDIPIEFIGKLEIVSYLAEYRLKTKKFDFNKLISKLSNGKAKHMIPVLESRRVQVPDEDLDIFYTEILSKKRICDLLDGKKKFQCLLNDIETGNYIDDVEIVERWETAISRSWNKITEIKRIESVECIQSLDLLNDDYRSVESAIREAYLPTNIIRSGYRSVDRLFPNGGFEKSRLYIIGGTSGIGKSTFLDNLPANAINDETNTESGDYLIVTGENLISETLERLYCIITGTPHVTMVSKILHEPGFSLKTEIVNHLTEKRSNIILKYFKSGRSTTEDIRIIIDEVAQRGRLKAAYIDYLDLVRSKHRFEDLRIDLGQVCVDFKDHAIEYGIPIITPTQLNKSGYDKDVAPTLTSMSESMKKVDNADFILFLQPATEALFTIPHELGGQKICKKIKMTALKNRNGEEGSSVYVMTSVRHNENKIFNYRIEEMPRVSIDPQNPTVPESYMEDIQEGWGRF